MSTITHLAPTSAPVSLPWSPTSQRRRGVGVAGQPPAHPLHLTRRGRLARTLLLTLATVLLATLATGGLLAGATSAERTVTVQPGQTLSHLAQSNLPDLSLERGVLALQEANGLSSSDVQAGQVLVVPEAP